MSRARCANPRCRRWVEREPVVVTVAGHTLVYGLTCARRAGLLPKARTTRRYAVATPRVPDATPVEVLPDQAPLWGDDEGIDGDAQDANLVRP